MGSEAGSAPGPGRDWGGIGTRLDRIGLYKIAFGRDPLCAPYRPHHWSQREKDLGVGIVRVANRGAAFHHAPRTVAGSSY